MHALYETVIGMLQGEEKLTDQVMSRLILDKILSLSPQQRKKGVFIFDMLADPPIEMILMGEILELEKISENEYQEVPA